MKQNKVYRVRWSGYLTLSTCMFVGLLLTTAGWLVFGVVTGGMPAWLGLLLCGLVVASLLLSWLYEPRFVVLTGEMLEFHRRFGGCGFAYDDIAFVEAYPDNRQPVRIFGIGGVFGHVGYYRTKSLGRFVSYVGDYSQAFYVRLRSGQGYLFSCDRRDEVIRLCRERIHSLD